MPIFRSTRSRGFEVTQLADELISKIRNLPGTEQDAIALMVFSHLGLKAAKSEASLEFVREIEALRDGLDNGTTEMATDAEVAACREACGF